MCILCVIQKWSRRVATMLPWLVLPLIGLWALSQLFPPAFRFEITSPRLACVFVLLVTLFWYEILMPKLSAWRARRNAWLREKKRNEAIELQKLRKTATRKCRNCLTPYRDQNPGGGKFMCSYCGHISKRPVLELPVPPGMGMSSSGIFKDLIGKGGKLLNGRAWSDNKWICSEDWRDDGNWAAGSFASKPINWRKNGNGLFGGDESCLAGKSYSGIVVFTCRLLASFFLSIRWLWRKMFCSSSLRVDAAFNAEHNGMLTKRGESGGNFQESRSDKARRKAEEKRQARLERELLEEEERKQREEVARLVEERRKLRDEKTATEKDSEKAVSPVKDNHSKKEAEKRRHERRKERDRGSSKSNSDAEELDKRVGKETDWKHDSDKKSEAVSREYHKSVIDSMKGQNIGVTRGSKSLSGNNVSRGSAGARYLDRMRGTFISSSKALSGTNFFGRTTNTSTAITKESKSNNVVNHAPVSAPKRDVCPPVHVAGKSATNGVPVEVQPIPAPKKSWQQLFTRSTPVHPSSNPNVISRPNTKMPAEVQSPPLTGQAVSTQSFDSPISFGLPSPFPAYSLQKAIPSSSLGFSPAIEPMFPHLGERPLENMPEEPELFEDPCYVPDPVSLLGPVSESLDNFQLDLGSSFISDAGPEKSRLPKTSTVVSEISRPSPIESPMSRRIVGDKNNNSNRLPSAMKSQEKQSSPVEDASINDEKTWQMWGPSPLGQEGLDFIAGTAWHLNPELRRLSREDSVHPSTQRLMTCFTKEDPVLPNIYSPRKDFLGSGPSGDTFNAAAISNDEDPLLQKAFLPPLSDNEEHFPFKRQELSSQNDIFFGTPARPTSSHQFEPSAAKCWSNKVWAAPDSEELIGSQSVAVPQTGELYPPQMYSHFGTESGK